MIYLDNSATTAPCPEAVEAAAAAMTHWGNPSSLHRLGTDARERLEIARAAVAAALGAERSAVVFTSGGTEADNLAIFGAAEKLGKRGRHLITTAYEHHAVLHPMEKLERQGFEVTYLQPDAAGAVTLEAFTAALRPDTVFASVMLVNNEIGAVAPIQQMARALHRVNPEAIFHTDAVQGLFKVPFSARSLGADLISVSAHKIHGLKGAGALYIRPGLHLPSQQLGGGQEGNLRSGTEALPAIAAFGAACAAGKQTAAQDMAAMAVLRDALAERIGEVPGAKLLGVGAAPHIVSLSVPGLRSQGLINCLQDREVYVSAGSACSRGHRSHVLTALGCTPEEIDGAIRVSFGRENRPEDVDAFLAALRESVDQLKGGRR